MASAMASAASRNIPPPYTIPVGPRVRPPRLLPGTKAANTNPRPDEPPPTPGHVWVQGRWRDPGSNAAKDRRQLESTQAEKALRHATHGMNIYAYSNMRTNQVVYSLSRIMQNNKILEQLIFHGKQTVPSALRRDMWRPYFSMHFDRTPAGAEAGLKAYRRLRELATQRQLSPPSELITATAADVQRAEARYTPTRLAEKKRNKSLKNMPVKNQMLPKKLRARKLMDQKATSVADACLVVGLLEKEMSPAEALEVAAGKREARNQSWSSRALKRLETIREKETTKEAQIEARQRTIQADQGQLGLTPHAARRIAVEHGGAVRSPWKGMEYQVENPESLKQLQETAFAGHVASETSTKQLEGEQRPAELDEKKYRAQYVQSWKEQNPEKAEGPSDEDINAAVKQEQIRIKSQLADYERRVAEVRGIDVSEMQERNTNSRKVHILWADIRDATWAERWPENVYHGELESRAALKHEKVMAQQQMTVDEEGNEVPGYQKKFVVQTSSTPHVIGLNNQIGWYETPERLSEQRQKRKDERAVAWQEEKLQISKEIIQRIDVVYQEKSRLQKRARDIQPEVNMANRITEVQAEDEVINTPAEAEEYEARTSISKAKNNVTRADQQLQALQRDYPSLYKTFLELLEWRQSLEAYTVLSSIKSELQDLKATSETGDLGASQRLQQIDNILTSHSTNQEHLQELVSPDTNAIRLQSDLLSSIAKSNQRITQYEQRIASLEATDPESPELQEARNLLENEHDLISSSRDETWTTRINAVEDALMAIDREYKDTGIIDLIEQRTHAEQSGNTEAVENLTAELKEREDDKLSSLLGWQTQIEPRVYQLDQRLREKGVEMPPPKQSGGFFGRIRGLFGR